METRRVATVIGGSGFLGRYIVKRLAAEGYVVRAAVRDPGRALYLKPMGAVGQVVPIYANVTADGTLGRAIEGAEIVVNTVGILAERKAGDFQRLQAEGAGRAARLAAASGARSFVHISAIGADAASPAKYAQSKAEGERLVREAFPGAVILRPSLVFGAEDQFFNRFASLALVAPIMPVIEGNTRFQPVYVGDVANAALAAIDQPSAAGRIFELGGPKVMGFREILGWILAQIGRHRPLVAVPRGAAGVLARVPFSGITADQLLLLRQDNVVSPGMPDLAALGLTPTPIDLVVPAYLARYRRGGMLANRLGPNRT